MHSPKTSMEIDMMDDLAPHHMLAQSFGAPNDEQIVLSPGDGHIHPPFVLDEPNISSRVIYHAVKDNNVSFLTLESIHCVYVVLQIG